MAPVDAGGEPLPADPSADEVIGQLAEQAQSLRTQAFSLREQAAEMRTNAQLLRTNVELVRRHVGESETGLTQARERNTARRSIVDQAPAAVQASEAKARDVASRAPQGEARAGQERARSEPMAGEARDLAGQSQANVPRDDPEAAANAREQSGRLGRVSGDISRIDEAVTEAGQAAGQLGQDAAQATQRNTAARGKVDAARASVEGIDSRITGLQERNAAATAQVDSLAGGPAQLLREADALDAEASRLLARSEQLETQLYEIRDTYDAGMRSVPAVQEAAPEDEAAPMGETEAEGAAGTEAAAEAETTAPEASASAAGMPETEPLEAGNQAEEGTEDLAASTPPATGPEGSGEDRAAAGEPGAGETAAPRPINLGEGLGWLTGESEPNAEERQRAQEAAEQRQREALAIAQGGADEDFASLSAGERRMRALRIMGNNLFGGVSRITWADVGRGAVSLATALIDPRTTLAGVISGLNMIANGVAGFVRAPSWEGLLRAAASVSLGLTIILGSITALAGLIIAAMLALSVVTVGAAAPVTGPVIAFCTTVMTTVGGWTFYVGLVAAGLQALLFLIDLYRAGTAQTAEELVGHADAMTQDAANAGNALLQAGMGRLAQIGGRQMQGAIARAGGGVGFARQIGQRSLLGQAVRGSARATRLSGGGRLARVAVGARLFGRGLVRGARGMARSVYGAGRRAFGRIGTGLRAGWRSLRAARRLGFGRTARVLGQRAWGAFGRGVGRLTGAGGRFWRSAQETFTGGLGAGLRRIGGRVRTRTSAWFREGLEDIRAGFSREFLTGEGAPIRAPGSRARPVGATAESPPRAPEPEAPPRAPEPEAPPRAPEPEAPPQPETSAPTRPTAATRRLEETEQALARARQELAEARQAAEDARATLEVARNDRRAAEQLAAETGNSADAQSLLNEASAAERSAGAAVTKADRNVQGLLRSEEAAVAEHRAVSDAQTRIAALESRIREIDTQLTLERHPPGGFSTELLRAGRRPGVIPARTMPGGARYHALEAEREALLRSLQSEEANLSRSLADQVARAVPGAEGRPLAMSNADTLPDALRPRNGRPIDLESGNPLPANAEWQTDHIMARTEIARDPRFARLTPRQRDAMLLEVPENYLPLTPELNQMKSNRTVDQFIRYMREQNRPLPPRVAYALREADRRARDAIERKFGEFLGQ